MEVTKLYTHKIKTKRCPECHKQGAVIKAFIKDGITTVKYRILCHKPVKIRETDYDLEYQIDYASKLFKKLNHKNTNEHFLYDLFNPAT